MNKIKLFTHTDMDGAGSAVIANVIYGKNNVDVEYCDYDNINEKILEFIETKSYDKYAHVFITDISINEEVAEIIENTQPESFNSGFYLNEKFELLDHHNTALNLNKYWWCAVKEYDNEQLNNYKTSGTYMFYNSIIEEIEDYNSLYNEDKSLALYEFANTIREYDTWEWVKNNNFEAKDLNDLFHLLGSEKFVEKFTTRFEKHALGENFVLFDKFDLLSLSINNDKIVAYIDRKAKHLIYTTFMNYKVGVIFAEKHISELGNSLSERNPDVDFVAIVNIEDKVNVSLRTVKNHVDLGRDIASLYGGGGHAKAAGFHTDLKFIDSFLDKLFQT